ncbi:MAG: helix-turn-helix transcriptional regulator [Campylobacteraceae bacterium]|nr:helix-turn-helix transcriptional regulator [Campylobacteraceae bacterium]
MGTYISTSQLWDRIEKEFSPYEKRNSGSIILEEDFGNMSLNFFNTGSGINYSSCVATFHEDTILEGQYNKNISYLIFNTSTNIKMESNNYSSSLDLNTNTYYKGQRFNGLKEKALYQKNKKYIFHYLVFEDNLLESLIKDENKLSLNLSNQILLQQNILLKELSEITLIEENIRDLYYESKILELTYNTINNLNESSSKSLHFLNKKDIEALHKAKEILFENINNPPSLKELAHKSAINEFKLKKGFKQLFGNTVYGLLQEYRLNKAKKLLEIDDINISEAAYLVGYKNISHFSTIFKKYFGYSPINIKKKQKKYYL